MTRPIKSYLDCIDELSTLGSCLNILGFYVHDLHADSDAESMCIDLSSRIKGLEVSLKALSKESRLDVGLQPIPSESTTPAAPPERIPLSPEAEAHCLIDDGFSFVERVQSYLAAAKHMSPLDSTTLDGLLDEAMQQLTCLRQLLEMAQNHLRIKG